jgi:hypothetical protein
MTLCPILVAAAVAADVADDDDLGLVELDAGRAGGHRGEQREVLVDLLRGRHLDLAERDGDAERRRGVRDVHRLEGVLGPHVLAAALRRR